MREALAIVQVLQTAVLLNDVVALVVEVPRAEDRLVVRRTGLVVVPLGLLERAEVLGTSSEVLMAK